MSATVFEKQGDVLTVRYEGRLDTATSPVLAEEMEPRLADESVRHVVLDFEKVRYVSSGGIRLILATAQRMAGRGGDLKLVRVNPYIVEVLGMVGLEDFVEKEQN